MSWFKMKLLHKHRSALQRQIREALEIEGSGAEIILNKRNEWNGSRIPRIRIEVADRLEGELEEQGDNTRDILFKNFKKSRSGIAKKRKQSSEYQVNSKQIKFEESKLPDQLDVQRGKNGYNELIRNFRDTEKEGQDGSAQEVTGRMKVKCEKEKENEKETKEKKEEKGEYIEKEEEGIGLFVQEGKLNEIIENIVEIGAAEEDTGSRESKDTKMKSDDIREVVSVIKTQYFVR